MRKPVRNTVPEFKQKPGLLFQPDVYNRMQKGINRIADAIRPTLGPLPRLVANQPAIDNRSPELLDCGAVIARRIIDLPDPDANVGAMLIRGMLWHLNEQVGDGTATAALFYQSIFNGAIRYIVAGGNPMLLRTALEKSMGVLLEELSRMAQPLYGKTMLARVAGSACSDPGLAAALGDIFHVVGEYGGVEIRSGRGRELEREYVAGSYWPSGISSPHLILDQIKKKTEMADAAILLSDLEIEEPQELLPVFRAAVQAQVPSLMIVARRFSDSAIAVLVSSLKSEKMRVIGAKTPGMRSDDQMYALQDLAALTGGRAFLQAAGETLAGVRPEDFGRARQLWADMDYLGVTGGKGSPRKLREYIASLRGMLENASEEELHNKTLERIGRLSGGTAILHVGGLTQTEIETRKELAGRAADAVRGALREGVLPGGGTAWLACRPRLRQALKECCSLEERAACTILLAALETPFRTILENAGFDPGEGLSRLAEAGPDHMFDVLRGQVVNVSTAGVLDSAAVQKAALHSAVRSAAMALTIDVFVHRRKPPVVTEPD